MAFDGAALNAVIIELKEKIVGGRIDKIFQPERDEIVLYIRKDKTRKLLLTVNAKYPRLHLAESAKENPPDAPLFCMVLRKWLAGGRVLDIFQPEFDRAAVFLIEAKNEMGDYAVKKLIAEIMGKHSNLILTDENDIIIDSQKRVTKEISSVREVFPGLAYRDPPRMGKISPLGVPRERFYELVKTPDDVFKNFLGISPVLSKEIAGDYETFLKIFHPDLNVIYKSKKSKELNSKEIFDFAFFDLKIYSDCEKTFFNSPSETIERYYAESDPIFRIKQKTGDLKKIIQNNIDRCEKKSILYKKSFSEIENRESLKLYGELIYANIASIKPGDESLTCADYYSGGETTVLLEKNLTPAENAQKYYKKYNKAKRTAAALAVQIIENDTELKYLETVMATLPFCVSEGDINEIRAELRAEGYLRKFSARQKRPVKTSPLKFISSGGFEIYVGKNNSQNDQLTRSANGSDIWLHVKNIPGAHVVLKTNNRPPSDEAVARAIEEAARLAARYSSARGAAEVDYALKKHVKKPAGAKPGAVIYDHFKTIYATGGDANGSENGAN